MGHVIDVLRASKSQKILTGNMTAWRLMARACALQDTMARVGDTILDPKAFGTKRNGRLEADRSGAEVSYMGNRFLAP